MKETDRTYPERKFAEKIQQNEEADYTTGNPERDNPANGQSWGSDRTIRAHVFREVVLAAGKERGLITVRGAKINGIVDLDHSDIRSAIMLDGCYLNGIKLNFANIRIVSLQNSHIHYLSAQQLKTDLVLLNCSTFEKGIDLRSAHIGGNLVGRGLRCYSSEGKPALNALGIRVDGSILLEGAIARGLFTKQGTGVVDLREASITGQLSCDRSSFGNSCGPSMTASSIKVGTWIYLTNGWFQGAVNLNDADIGGSVCCLGSRFLKGSSGEALVADAMTVKGSVQLGPPTSSLADKAAKFYGQIRLPGARITGNLDCDYSSFRGAHAVIIANGIYVEGAVRFRNSKIYGEVTLSSARIGGDLDFNEAQFCEHSGLVAERVAVAGRLWWRKIRLTPDTLLDLQNAKAGILVDDKESWPHQSQLYIDGFVYDTLSYDKESLKEPSQRLEWLGRQEKVLPQPYRQLANVFRRDGHEKSAQQVLVGLERSRDKSETRACLQKAGRFLYRQIEYGYLPLRGALWCAFGVVVFGWLVVCFSENTGIIKWLGNGHSDPLSPFWYSLDVFLPIHPLHQQERWWPIAEQWHWCLCWPSIHTLPWGWLLRLWLWIEILFGWILTGLIIASLSGIVRRE